MEPETRQMQRGQSWEGGGRDWERRSAGHCQTLERARRCPPLETYGYFGKMDFCAGGGGAGEGREVVYTHPALHVTTSPCSSLCQDQTQEAMAGPLTRENSKRTLTRPQDPRPQGPALPHPFLRNLSPANPGGSQAAGWTEGDERPTALGASGLARQPWCWFRVMLGESFPR